MRDAPGHHAEPHLLPRQRGDASDDCFDNWAARLRGGSDSFWGAAQSEELEGVDCSGFCTRAFGARVPAGSIERTGGSMPEGVITGTRMGGDAVLAPTKSM